jgi:membrane-associated phospholipid phosphatase
MSATSLPDVFDRTPTDHAIRLSGLVAVGFLALGTVPMVFYARESADAIPLIAHLAALTFGVAIVSSRRSSLRVWRDWTPLVLGAFLYVDLRWLIEGVGRPHADALVQHWERMLFPSEPAATWAIGLPVPWISELLHLCYASYYPLVLVPPALLYARGRRVSFAATLLALTIAYASCFAAYLVFPVEGPRYLVGPAAAPDGPIRAFVLRLLETGSSRGTAFPSSHVAASVVAALAALRFQPPVGIVVSMLTLGLAAATVYGGFHYAVDAVVGAAVGLAAWGVSRAICRALSTPGAQSASAP